MALISKKARYALHGLAYIAVHSRDEPVSFNEILGYLRAYSQRLTLSPGYIAKIFQEVSRAGFTEAVSGPRGGYRLSRAADRISLATVVEALDGPLLSGCCLMSAADCPRENDCGVRSLLDEAGRGFYDYLEGESIASLAQRMAFPEPEAVRAHQPGISSPRWAKK